MARIKDKNLMKNGSKNGLKIALKKVLHVQNDFSATLFLKLYIKIPVRMLRVVDHTLLQFDALLSKNHSAS